jgi:hypothetical protein
MVSADVEIVYGNNDSYRAQIFAMEGSLSVALFFRKVV